MFAFVRCNNSALRYYCSRIWPNNIVIHIWVHNQKKLKAKRRSINRRKDFIFTFTQQFEDHLFIFIQKIPVFLVSSSTSSSFLLFYHIFLEISSETGKKSQKNASNLKNLSDSIEFLLIHSLFGQVSQICFLGIY